MSPFEASPQRHSSQQLFQLKIFFGVLFMVFLWMIVEYSMLRYKSYQIDSKKQWFIEENELLMANNQELEKQYEYYKTDYFFRKEAKRKLNKREADENVVIIAENKKKSVHPVNFEISDDIPGRWWKYLFGE